jgi:hypothetical protein
MKQLILPAGLVLFFTGVWFLWPDHEPLLSQEHAPRDYIPAQPDAAPERAPVETLLSVGAPPSTERAPVGFAAPPEEELTEDANALLLGIQQELDLLRDENAGLRAQLAIHALEAERARYPEDSPYGAFLQSYEAEQLPDQLERDQVKYALEEIPVFLNAGEATWIVERYRNDDWKSYAETRDVAMIRFIGSARVLAEAPPEKMDQYREWYDESEWLALFGTVK